MKLMRSSYSNRFRVPGRGRLTLETSDCIIIATLVLLVAMAVLTAPRSATQIYQKLQALLLIEAMPDWIASAGAIGQPIPVSR